MIDCYSLRPHYNIRHLHCLSCWIHLTAILVGREAFRFRVVEFRYFCSVLKNSLTKQLRAISDLEF